MKVINRELETTPEDEKPGPEWRPPRVEEQRKDKDNAIPEINAWMPEVDLGGLIEAQKVIAKQMLTNEELKMKIRANHHMYCYKTVGLNF